MFQIKRAQKNIKFCPIWILSTIIMLFALLLAGCSSDNSSNTQRDVSNNTNNSPEIEENGNLVIPISEISSTVQFYPVTIDGTKMEVLAVEAPDGSIRTAFNTCQICYGSGKGYYEQSGDALVCQNCGNQFKMSQVEIESGGCNPWLIFEKDKTVTDESITISYDFLKESIEIFENWKTEY